MSTSDIENEIGQIDLGQLFNESKIRINYPEEVVYTSINSDVLIKASNWPMVYENPTSSISRIVDAYRIQNIDLIRNEFTLVTNDLLAEYIEEKTEEKNPTWIFRGKQFINFIYFYTLNFGVDRWLIDNVILPIIEAVTKDASTPVLLNRASPIYAMLYELNRIDEDDFDYLLPKLIDKRFEIAEFIDPDTEAKNQTSFDLLNVLISGEKPNRLLKYFKLGGKISNSYLDSGNKVNYPPNLSKVSSYGINSILWDLGVMESGYNKPNDLAHGFHSYTSARGKVKSWFNSYSLLHTGTTSVIYGFNKQKLLNKDLYLAILLLSIRCSKVKDIENICLDPEDAVWHKVFVKYINPSQYSLDISRITINNFEEVAALIYRNMLLLQKFDIQESLCLRDTLKHVFNDVLPVLGTFKEKTRMLELNCDEVQAEINSKFIFNLYLNTSDESIVKGLEENIIDIIKKLYKDKNDLKIEDYRFGILPSTQNYI